MNSTGTRAYLLDPTKALHGDLGMVHPDDLVIVLSHSGESEEIVRLLGPLRELSSGIIALTGNAQSTLGRTADVALVYGAIVEACPLTLAPSTSTTIMLALGDALAFVLSDYREFTAEEFARFHPAGSPRADGAGRVGHAAGRGFALGFGRRHGSSGLCSSADRSPHRRDHVDRCQWTISGRLHR